MLSVVVVVVVIVVVVIVVAIVRPFVLLTRSRARVGDRILATGLQDHRLQLLVERSGDWSIGDACYGLSARVHGSGCARASVQEAVWHHHEHIQWCVCAGLLVICVCVSHVCASGAVEKRFAWNKQILHVWCEKASNAKVIEEEFYRMPSELCADTVVLLTVAENSDYIFSSKFYPLPMGVRPIVVDRRRGRP